jgi:hypothetical protein
VSWPVVESSNRQDGGGIHAWVEDFDDDGLAQHRRAAGEIDGGEAGGGDRFGEDVALVQGDAGEVRGRRGEEGWRRKGIVLSPSGGAIARRRAEGGRDQGAEAFPIGGQERLTTPSTQQSVTDGKPAAGPGGRRG